MSSFYKFLLFLFIANTLFSCNNETTYADRREAENQQIQTFLKQGREFSQMDGEIIHVDGNIKVISEEEFYAQDSTTNLNKNEYVLFRGSGVYMQLIRKGAGEKIKANERVTLFARYAEFSLPTGSILSHNLSHSTATLPDVLNVNNTSGSFTASFVSGTMRNLYSAAVPSGWLIAMPFIRIGRQDSSTNEIAKIRLIVPSTEGQTQAFNNVLPTFYEITFQRSR